MYVLCEKYRAYHMWKVQFHWLEATLTVHNRRLVTKNERCSFISACVDLKLHCPHITKSLGSFYCVHTVCITDKKKLLGKYGIQRQLLTSDWPSQYGTRTFPPFCVCIQFSSLIYTILSIDLDDDILVCFSIYIKEEETHTYRICNSLLMVSSYFHGWSHSSYKAQPRVNHLFSVTTTEMKYYLKVSVSYLNQLHRTQQETVGW